MKPRTYRTIKGAEKTAARLRGAYPDYAFTVMFRDWRFVIRAEDISGRISFVGASKLP